MTACGHTSVGLVELERHRSHDKKSVAAAFNCSSRTSARAPKRSDNDKKGVYPYRELFGLLKRYRYDRYTMWRSARPTMWSRARKFLKEYKKTLGRVDG